MKTIFIAELGSNHNQNYHRAIDLIDSAKACGFDKVKFQLYTKDTLYAPGYAPENLIEFPVEWISAIYKHCVFSEIELGYSIFHESFIEKLMKPMTYCDFLKISSWDVLRHDLIRKCLDTELPFMISLGGISYGEFMHLITVLDQYNHNQDIVLFHCIPKYPCERYESNLEMIASLTTLMNGKNVWSDSLHTNIFIGERNYRIGWSDHSNDFAIIYVAIAKGADIIELHFDLDDCEGNETHHGHVWTAYQAGRFIKSIREKDLFHKNDFIDDQKIFKEERLQRADPSDGLRPMKVIRK